MAAFVAMDNSGKSPSSSLTRRNTSPSVYNTSRSSLRVSEEPSPLGSLSKGAPGTAWTKPTPAEFGTLTGGNGLHDFASSQRRGISPGREMGISPKSASRSQLAALQPVIGDASPMFALPTTPPSLRGSRRSSIGAIKSGEAPPAGIVRARGGRSPLAGVAGATSKKPRPSRLFNSFPLSDAAVETSPLRSLELPAALPIPPPQISPQFSLSSTSSVTDEAADSVEGEAKELLVPAHAAPHNASPSQTVCKLPQVKADELEDHKVVSSQAIHAGTSDRRVKRRASIMKTSIEPLKKTVIDKVHEMQNVWKVMDFGTFHWRVDKNVLLRCPQNWGFAFPRPTKLGVAHSPGTLDCL